MLRKLNYANVVSTLALFAALGGVTYAAIKVPANSVGSKQIKKNAVTSEKVKNGNLIAADFRAGEIPAGDMGPPGPTGGSGVVSTEAFSGDPGDSYSLSTQFTFIGPQATVSTTGTQRLTSSAGVPIGIQAAGQMYVVIALCYQADTGGALTVFQASPSSVPATIDASLQALAGTVVPGAGTWKVGACVRKQTPGVLNNNDVVNGYVQVTN